MNELQSTSKVGTLTDKVHQSKVITQELAILQTAYPTQARNFSQAELRLTAQLWMELFAEVEEESLHLGVLYFLKKDRKGFFPSPGQIMGAIEEREKAEQLEKDRVKRQEEKEVDFVWMCHMLENMEKLEEV